MGIHPGFDNNDLTKLFANPFLTSFDKMSKQIIAYNRNLLLTFNSQVKESATDLRVISKKYMETIENRLETAKNIFNTLQKAYNSKVDFSMETNKKAMEEISNQFYLLIKQNQQSWTDMLEKCEVSLNGKDKL